MGTQASQGFWQQARIYTGAAVSYTGNVAKTAVGYIGYGSLGQKAVTPVEPNGPAPSREGYMMEPQRLAPTVFPAPGGGVYMEQRSRPPASLHSSFNHVVVPIAAQDVIPYVPPRPAPVQAVLPFSTPARLEQIREEQAKQLGEEIFRDVEADLNRCCPKDCSCNCTCRDLVECPREAWKECPVCVCACCTVTSLTAGVGVIWGLVEAFSYSTPLGIGLTCAVTAGSVALFWLCCGKACVEACSVKGGGPSNSPRTIAIRWANFTNDVVAGHRRETAAMHVRWTSHK